MKTNNEAANRSSRTNPHSLRRVAWLSLLLMGLPVACSDKDAQKADAGAGGSVSSAAGTGGAAAVAMVGPEGGVVASADGNVRIDIPPGALSVATPITVSPASNVPVGALGPAYDIGPSGTKFASPAIVSFPLPAGGDSGDTVVSFVDSNGLWSPLEVVWSTSTTVHAATSHLTIFAPIKPGSKTTAPECLSCSPAFDAASKSCVAKVGGKATGKCSAVGEITTPPAKWVDDYLDCFESSVGESVSPCSDCLRNCCVGTGGALYTNESWEHPQLNQVPPGCFCANSTSDAATFSCFAGCIKAHGSWQAVCSTGGAAGSSGSGGSGGAPSAGSGGTTSAGSGGASAGAGGGAGAAGAAGGPSCNGAGCDCVAGAYEDPKTGSLPGQLRVVEQVDCGISLQVGSIGAGPLPGGAWPLVGGSVLQAGSCDWSKTGEDCCDITFTPTTMTRVCQVHLGPCAASCAQSGFVCKGNQCASQPETVVATKVAECKTDVDCGSMRFCNVDGFCQSCLVGCSAGQCFDGQTCQVFGNGCAQCKGGTP